MTFPDGKGRSILRVITTLMQRGQVAPTASCKWCFKLNQRLQWGFRKMFRDLIRGKIGINAVAF